MRKFIAMLLTVALLVTGYGACFADRLKLPAAVQTIEKEAFYGDTSIKEVVVPYGTQYIMARAFAYSGIEKIYIPDTVTFIASNAFDGADDVVICAPEGSYAAAFAEEYDYLLQDTGFQYSLDQHTTFEMLLDELGNLNDVDPMTFMTITPIQLSTEGITDQATIEVIEKLNDIQREMVENNNESNEIMRSIVAPIYDVAKEIEGFSVKAISNGISFEGSDISYSVSVEGIDNIGNDLEIISVSADEESNSLLIELLIDGQRYYAKGNGFSFTVTPAKSNNSSARIVSNYSASDFMVRDPESMKRILESWKNKLDLIQLGITTIGQKAGDIATKQGIVKEGAETWIKEIELKKKGTTDPEYIKYYDNLIKNQKKIINDSSKQISKATWISRACAAFSVKGTFQSLSSNIKKISELISVWNHGHPKGAELSDGDKLQLIAEMKIALKSACAAYFLNAVNNLIDLLIEVAAILAATASILAYVISVVISEGATSPAIFPMLESMAAGLGTQSVKTAIANFFAEIINGIVADVKYKEVMDKDKLLHQSVYGVVRDAESKQPIKNVLIRFNGLQAYTNSEGFFRVSMPAGTHTLVFSKKDYKEEPVTVTVKENQSTECNVDMTCKGVLTGKVFDASTLAPLSGVTVVFGYYKTTTNASGVYRFEVPKAGNTESISATKDGYITYSDRTTCEIGKTNVYDIPIAKEMELGTYKVVLRWGSTPKDLDSHLQKAGGYHVYYASKTAEGASLDVDDTTSYGPETTTFKPDANGTYTYYVHDFTNRDNPGSKALSKSGAVVHVYCGSEQVGIYRVPSNVGLNWTVFTITNGVYKAAG